MQNKLPGDLKRVRVESVREIAENAYVLEYKRFFEFEAGQIISISLSAEEPPRMYSIASGEKDENIQVLFNVVSEGKLTPALSGLKKGDFIWTSPGFGKFTGTSGKACWIAQGTGIAPFASMFRSGQRVGKTLIHGGRYPDSFYYADEFELVLKENYIRCCSREIVPGTFHGRVTDYLNSLDSLSADSLYYLCGSSEMVVETRDLLIKKGVSFTRIVGEIYF
jgi:ferredoxin--NADP+ reductase